MIKMEKNPIKQRKEINLGISILRVILSFMVVMDHLYNTKKFSHYLYILYYHIPTFFVISFYYTYKTLISFDIPKLKLRYQRLLIPYVSYSIIGWILNNIHFYIFKKDCSHSLKDFLHNLLNGHIFNVALWFQINLIVITTLFIIVIFIFKNYHLSVLNIICILTYIFQYSGANYHFFRKYFTPHYTLSLGRLSENFPNALIGFFLASTNIVEKLNHKNGKTIFYSLIILIIITKYKLFHELLGYKYGGIRNNIAAICIFLIFLLLPCQKVNIKIKKVINQMTKYTGGIYLSHYLIGKGILIELIIYIKKKTLFGCIIVYCISYITCCLGTKLLGKTIFRHLFA